MQNLDDDKKKRKFTEKIAENKSNKKIGKENIDRKRG